MITEVDLKHLRRCVELARTALEKEMNPLVQYWFLAMAGCFKKTTTTWLGETTPSIQSLI